MRALALTATGLVLLLALGGAASSFSSSKNTAAAVGSCPNGKPAKGVTKIQAIQLDLLRRSSFNNLDGPQVVRDLLSHRQLWCAALIDRLGSDALIKLRDLDDNYWNVDTLYVLSSGANDPALARLAGRWHSDARSWVGGSAASQLLGDSRPRRILEVWWD
jgi:hypothetical protein